jgi:hypothetical protein
LHNLHCPLQWGTAHLPIDPPEEEGAGITTKTVDPKGRLTLGREFAGRTVQVADEHEGMMVLTFCRVVPEREAWLWENEAAIASVGRGLMQARRGELSDGSDLADAFDFAESIPDEE